jgi:ATP/maltotriose-dependent transcriptional regulator MalT/DNA-binding SARP family transcriptional activator
MTDAGHGRPTVFATPAAGLVRRRLLDDLAALRSARLALVVAPAGAGKTTLLAQYAAGYDAGSEPVAGPVGWWRVDSTDTTGEHVLRGVRDALFGPGTTAFAGPEELLAAAGGADRLLIVDDVHHLNGTAGEPVLEQLIARAPSTLHVLVAGRHLPGFNLSRHELSGVRILDAEQLRFRYWEVERLLREVYREPLPPDDVAALSRRVDGWAAGLHMFHLSTHGRPLPERQRAVAALDGRSTLIRGYLAHTVLAELPARLREFLVRTCVFDTLTGARCDRLLETTGSAALLAELERLQAFTVTHDGGHSYRYHEVLRAHLAVTLTEELGEQETRAWYRRAAELAATEGATVEAARAYARADDWPAVRRLLDRIGAQVANEGLEPWRDLLPGWLVAQDPWLLLAEGRHRLGRGQLAQAVDHLRAAEEQFTDERGRSWCRGLRRLVAGWQPGRDPVPGHWSGRLREATRRHPELLAGNPAVGTLPRAAACLLAGDIKEARRVLSEDAPDDMSLPALGIRLLRAALTVADRDPEGRPALARVTTDAERAQLPWLVRMARAAGVLDGSERGLAEARTVAQECDRDGDGWGAAIARGLVCLVTTTAGTADPDEATELLRRCQALDATVLSAWAQLLHALAATAAGLPDAELEAQRAESLARSAGVPGARLVARALVADHPAEDHDVVDQAGLSTLAGLPELPSPRHAGGPARRDRWYADDRPDLSAVSAASALPNRLAQLAELAGESGLPAAVLAGWLGLPDPTAVPTGLPAVPAGERPADRTAPQLVSVGEHPPVEVWCLGSFRMHRDGRPLDWTSVKPRTRTALRLLAMHAGRPVHRESLTAALWPDTPAGPATHSLHVTLSSLRRFLDPDADARDPRRLLVRDGDAYALALPPGGYSDVAEFRAALDRAHRARLAGDTGTMLDSLRLALLSYGGDLLPEDGPAEWVVPEREALRRRAADAAAELAVAELRLGHADAAVDAAQRCVRVDEYCDAGWRALMDGFTQLGDVAAAARARRDYDGVLATLAVDEDDEPLASVSVIRGRTAPPLRSLPGFQVARRSPSG